MRDPDRVLNEVAVEERVPVVIVPVADDEVIAMEKLLDGAHLLGYVGVVVRPLARAGREGVGSEAQRHGSQRQRRPEYDGARCAPARLAAASGRDRAAFAHRGKATGMSEKTRRFFMPGTLPQETGASFPGGRELSCSGAAH
jgi:hypothetical protein